MTNDTPQQPDTSPADAETDSDPYDYTIDPLIGLPEIDLPDDDELADMEESLRIGRGDAPPEQDDTPAAVRYRSAASDPIFGYVLAMAVSFGLTPLLPGGAPMRYTLVWSLIAGFGVVAWLLGNGERIGQEKPEHLVWGVMIGIIAGTPLYLFGGATLTATASVLFGSLTPGALLAYLVFVMPLGETLFFRGILQNGRRFWVVGVMATAWSALLFFPLIRNLTDVWAVGIFIGTTLTIVNMVYSWVRERNGLAAAWLCQIVTNLILIFLPFISQAS